MGNGICRCRYSYSTIHATFSSPSNKIIDSPDQLGPPYPSLTILYQVRHVSLGGISCSGMRLILGGIKKSLVVGTSIAGPRQPRLAQVNGDFFLVFFIAHRTRDLSWHKGKGLVNDAFFVHYTVYYTSLAFLLLLLLLLLLITGDR